MKNFIKRIYLLITLLILLFPPANVAAQQVTTMTGNYTNGDYFNYSNSGITITNASFTPGVGQSVFLHIIATSCAPVILNPTGSQNFVATFTPRAAFSNLSQLAGRNTCELMQAVQYSDGLGRPMQTVQVNASPTLLDIVQPVAYDAYGREAVKYLPYASASANDGSYKPNALTDQPNFYLSPPPGVTQIKSPYAVTAFEPSPLNRPIEQGAPGEPWQLTGTTGLNATPGHTEKIAYLTNDQTTIGSTTPSATNLGRRIVSLYKAVINADQSRTLVRDNNNAIYATGQLYLTITKNENWNAATDGCTGTIEEYKDKEGHVVLKRTYNNNGTSIDILSTYYVYDDLGNLCFVLPPATYPDANAVIPQATLDGIAYQYRYDERNRLTQKKLPLKGWQFMVYNGRDQIVYTQDAVQRGKSPQVWTYIKYDALGRQVITGVWTSTDAGDANISAPGQTPRQNLANANANNFIITPRDNSTSTGYAVAAPAGPILTINYFDDYNIPSNTYAPTASDLASNTTGLQTGSKVMVLNTIATTQDMLLSVNYYDGLGRNRQSFKQHYLGGTLNNNNYDVVSSYYNFANQDTLTIRKHYTNNNGVAALKVTISNAYTYDQVGRKITTTEKLDNVSVVLSQLAYNEVGQLITKKLHSTDGGNTFLQPVNYSYNERGWMAGASSPLFAMRLKYIDSVTTPQYNGNIGAQYWGTPGSLTKNYMYTYDAQNRLRAGISNEGYDEKAIAYDWMGNVTSLTRQNNTYGYNYSYNRLNTITGGLVNGYYAYLANGNLSYDARNGTTITDNMLDLPQIITGTNINLTYTYDANGNKLRKISGNVTTDYIDGIQYDGGTLSFIQTEEGRAVYVGSGYNYYYNLSDHLGNTRLTFDTHTGATATVQQSDYYPFGLEIVRGSIISPRNFYLYNKKEWQIETGDYDYGARFYDPVIARWTTIDPAAEMGRRWSPYVYGFDDPIRFEDPDGMWPDWGDVASVSGSFVKGLGQSAWGTVTGVYGAVRHPINTAKALGHAVAHPVNTAKAIGKAVSKGYDDFKNGDGDTKANIAGNLIGDVAQVFVGTEEVKAATETVKAAEVAGDVEKVSEVADVAKSSEYIDVSGKNSVRNVQTDVTHSEFGSNLEQNGFTKTVSKDGKVTNYTKGDAKYSVRETPQTSRGTAGPSADYSNGTKQPTTKIRLNGGN